MSPTRGQLHTAAQHTAAVQALATRWRGRMADQQAAERDLGDALLALHEVDPRAFTAPVLGRLVHLSWQHTARLLRQAARRRREASGA